MGTVVSMVGRANASRRKPARVAGGKVLPGLFWLGSLNPPAKAPPLDASVSTPALASGMSTEARLYQPAPSSFYGK